jgi:uncharacterized protein (TIGR03067 family)
MIAIASHPTPEPAMIRRMLTLALFVSLALPLAADDKADAFDGTWVPVSAEMGGMKLPDEFAKAIKLVIKGDQYTVTVGDKTDKGTSKADPKAKTLDITSTEGENKGKTMLAIYEHKGDTLTVCYDVTGKERPKEFKSPAGSAVLLVTYKKEK